MKTPNTWRQGDVLVLQTDTPHMADWQEVPRKGGRVVLQDGKATGNAHVIAAQGATFYHQRDPETRDGLVPDRLLVLAEPATLSHEEHAPIDLPAGAFLVRIQREYSAGELRNVED